jgi:hypothetical protein
MGHYGRSYSNIARMKFNKFSGVSAERICKVRLFKFWEVGVKCHDHYIFNEEAVINDSEEFAKESRDAMKICLTDTKAE